MRRKRIPNASDPPSGDDTQDGESGSVNTDPLPDSPPEDTSPKDSDGDIQYDQHAGETAVDVRNNERAVTERRWVFVTEDPVRDRVGHRMGAIDLTGDTATV